MEPFSDETAIEAMLSELRPTPRPEFVAELDTRAAAGFARDRRRLRAPVDRLVTRLRQLPRRQALAAAGACAVIAVVAATAVLTISDEGVGTTRFHSNVAVGHGDAGQVARGQASAGAAVQSSGASATRLEANGSTPFSKELSAGHRMIERSAAINLLADPEDVAGDSAEVFAAVHDAHGIVLSSNTTQGPAGRAGAHFELLIPSARLGDALASLSAIDEVGSRHDVTTDITAPTVVVGKRLHETRASIDSLLSQLASAETESEREALEIELRRERGHAAALQAQLARLHRRTRYSHVSVSIETGDSSTSPGGAWGIDDALGSAGHVLAVAAGVTIVGLAVLAPLLVLILLAWLAYRAWLRIRREQALTRRV